MVDIQEFLWGFSLLSLINRCLKTLRKTMSLAIALALSSCPSSATPLSSICKQFVGRLGGSPFSSQDEDMKPNFIYQNGKVMASEEQVLGTEAEAYQRGLQDRPSKQDVKELIFEKPKVEETFKLRKRPSRLVLPECCRPATLELVKDQTEVEVRDKEFEFEGRDYFLASKRGRRFVMEDAHKVILDISGDRKQAFFAVIDGHGGREAADFVAENLGNNIVEQLECIRKEEEEEEDSLEEAVHRAYSVTDRDFLSKGIASGACTASVLLKEGHLHVANVGDCRVVLSRNGVADRLTNDHRLSREDERSRIENSGGFLQCRNGVWRVNGSLAVSRAIGDLHLKDWIISTPDIKKFQISSDSQFLIMASDGLWDKVSDQEAVDAVLCEKNLLDSCRKLVNMSTCRGNMDDITVMVINLQNFVAASC